MVELPHRGKKKKKCPGHSLPVLCTPQVPKGKGWLVAGKHASLSSGGISPKTAMVSCVLMDKPFFESASLSCGRVNGHGMGLSIFARVAGQWRHMLMCSLLGTNHVKANLLFLWTGPPDW